MWNKIKRPLEPMAFIKYKYFPTKVDKTAGAKVQDGVRGPGC